MLHFGSGGYAKGESPVRNIFFNNILNEDKKDKSFF